MKFVERCGTKALDASSLGNYVKADCPCCDEVSEKINEPCFDSTEVPDRIKSDKVDCKIPTVSGREALVVYLCKCQSPNVRPHVEQL